MPAIGSVLRCAGVALAVSAMAGARICAGQPAPVAADAPAIKVGVTLFADYTVQQQPKIVDADGNAVTFNAFQIGRSYINVTGRLSRTIAFRVTPDIARETGAGSSLNGSYTFRLKFAYLQWSPETFVSAGSFARFGMQPTPWVEFIDSVYRYRFQGSTLEDREGYLPSADVGASFRYNLPGNVGDLQAAAFNGETYTRAEVNDQKSVQLRGTIGPFRAQPQLRGLRVTGFWDHDAYVKHADRRRAIAGVTFEHPRLHAAATYMAARDQPSATSTAVDARAWSVFATPRTARGWEGLLRFDRVESNTQSRQTKRRGIAGIAYWFSRQGNVTGAVMLDVEQTAFERFVPAQQRQRRIALHTLVNF